MTTPKALTKPETAYIHAPCSLKCTATFRIYITRQAMLIYSIQMLCAEISIYPEWFYKSNMFISSNSFNSVPEHFAHGFLIFS